MDKSKFNMPAAIALIVLFATFAGLGYVIVSGAGGNEALFMIIGQVSGWAGATVTFYFSERRPKPSDDIETRKPQ